MFFPGSRYEKQERIQVTMPDGRVVAATRLPIPGATALQGYHRRLAGQRLDHIAYHYLRDAAGFWRLCDANNAMVPDALAASELVGIPSGKP